MGRKKVIHASARSSLRAVPYEATTRLEVMQLSLIAARKGDPIRTWQVHTDKGCRMLGVEGAATKARIITASFKFIPGVNVQICPGCHGTGCSICNESGITTKAMIKRRGDFGVDQMDGDLGGDLDKKRMEAREI
jgi:hypothetical protein